MGFFYVPDAGLIRDKCNPPPSSRRLLGREEKMQVHFIPKYIRTTLGRAEAHLSVCEMILGGTLMNCVYAFILMSVMKNKH